MYHFKKFAVFCHCYLKTAVYINLVSDVVRCQEHKHFLTVSCEANNSTYYFLIKSI